ncbi:MAG TPA: hypothetical protein VFH74_17030 [Gaiellales bacterium]|nr:hypothetical protein [Gaiellales bacterium]
MTEKVYALWDQRPVRRAVWAVVLVVLAIGLIAFIRSRHHDVTYQGSAVTTPQQPVFKDPGTQFGKKVPFPAEARSVVKSFVQEAILRKDPDAARKLVSAKILATVSAADWSAGTLPLPQFPPAYFGGAGYHVLRSRQRDVLLDVGLASTNPGKVPPYDMLVELRPVNGHWLVVSAGPRNSTPVPAAN